MKRVAIFTTLLVSLLVALTALAQTGGSFDLTWFTVDSGGGASGGGGYTASGSIGQPDAAILAGGGYTLVGGFWGGAPSLYNIYLPLVLRNASS